MDVVVWRMKNVREVQILLILCAHLNNHCVNYWLSVSEVSDAVRGFDKRLKHTEDFSVCDITLEDALSACKSKKEQHWWNGKDLKTTWAVCEQNQSQHRLGQSPWPGVSTQLQKHQEGLSHLTPETIFEQVTIPPPYTTTFGNHSLAWLWIGVFGNVQLYMHSTCFIIRKSTREISFCN